MQEFFDRQQTDFIDWLADQWDICFDRVKIDVDIQGSPERTVAREVIQAKDGQLLLVEKFSKDKFPLRHTVACAVDYLNQNGLESALAYKKSTKGEFLPFFKGNCFGVTDYLDSTGIKRPDYLASKHMGENFAQFLIAMSTASDQIETVVSLDLFSIKEYIYKLFSQMNIHDRPMHEKFSPVLKFLEHAFMDAHDMLPIGFCHGDLHPLNVIWNKDQIRAVIDWEFVGLKPQIYDAANLVGCAGIENPKGLAMPMVMSVLQQLQEEKVYHSDGWQFFPEYVLALRFAWLSEWLRKKDAEMIEMEAAFMKILMDNMDRLKSGWQF